MVCQERAGFAVLQDIDLHGAVAGVDSLFFVAVAVIVGVGALRFLVAEMIVHLGLHHLLDGSAEQIFESFLNIFGSLNVILLKEMLDDLAFAFVI